MGSIEEYPGNPQGFLTLMLEDLVMKIWSCSFSFVCEASWLIQRSWHASGNPNQRGFGLKESYNLILHLDGLQTLVPPNSSSIVCLVITHHNSLYLVHSCWFWFGFIPMCLRPLVLDQVFRPMNLQVHNPWFVWFIHVESIQVNLMTFFND